MPNVNTGQMTSSLQARSARLSVKGADRIRMLKLAWVFLYLDLLILLPRGGEVTALDAQAGYRIVLVLVAACLITLAHLGDSAAINNLFRGAIGLFFAFATVSLMSSMYASVAFYSMWKSMELVVVVAAIAAVLSSAKSWQRVCSVYSLTITLITLTVISAWIGALLFPGDAFVHEKGLIPVRLQGVYPPLNSNSVGSFAAIACLANLSRWLRNGRRTGKYAVVAVAMFATVVLSTSRTAMVGLLIAVTVLAVIDRKKGLIAMLLFLAVSAVALEVTQETASTWFKKGQADSTIESLSGRTKGWTDAWEKFQEAPLLGLGMASAGRFDVLGNGRASTLHGSFFDVLVGVGLLGALPWLAAIVMTGYRLFRPLCGRSWAPNAGFPRGEWIAMYSFLLVRGLTSSGLALHEKELMLMLCLAAAGLVCSKGSEERVRSS